MCFVCCSMHECLWMQEFPTASPKAIGLLPSPPPPLTLFTTCPLTPHSLTSTHTHTHALSHPPSLQKKSKTVFRGAGSSSSETVKALDGGKQARAYVENTKKSRCLVNGIRTRATGSRHPDHETCAHDAAAACGRMPGLKKPTNAMIDDELANNEKTYTTSE